MFGIIYLLLPPPSLANGGPDFSTKASQRLTRHRPFVDTICLVVVRRKPRWAYSHSKNNLLAKCRCDPLWLYPNDFLQRHAQSRTCMWNPFFPIPLRSLLLYAQAPKRVSPCYVCIFVVFVCGFPLIASQHRNHMSEKRTHNQRNL